MHSYRYATDDRVWTFDMARPLDRFERLRGCVSDVCLAGRLGRWDYVGQVLLVEDLPVGSFGGAISATCEVQQIRLVPAIVVPSEPRIIAARFATYEDQQVFARWLFR